MPHLDFELKNPCLTFEGNKESDKWRFNTSGKCTHRQGFDQSFTITSGSKSYDGFGIEALVYIEKRPPRSEAQGIPTDKHFDPNDKCRDIIHVTCPGSEIDQPFFEVTASLPPDAYQRLIDTDWTKHTLILSVENEIMGQALVYGGDPDGREIEWHIDKENHVFLKEVRLHFLAHGEQKNHLDEKTSKQTEDADDAPTSNEHVLAAAERITVTIAELRASVIKAAWVLAAVVLVTSFIK